MRASLLALTLCLLGCSEGGKIREWRPSDHDQPEDQRQVEANPQGGGGGGDVATEMLWRQQCIRCHGGDGRGGQMMGMRVADLRASTLEEAQIVQVVTKGRNQMPAFGAELPEDAIRALAQKVLSLRH